MQNVTTELAPFPSLPSVEEIYFYLMSEIEPDLTLAQSELDEKYKNETQEQRTERNARYQAADKTYQQAYTDYLANYKRQVTHYFKKLNEENEELEKSLITLELEL